MEQMFFDSQGLTHSLLPENFWLWVLFFLFGFIFFFFLIREFWTWYFKINKLEKLLEKIEENTRSTKPIKSNEFQYRPQELHKEEKELEEERVGVGKRVWNFFNYPIWGEKKKNIIDSNDQESIKTEY